MVQGGCIFSLFDEAYVAFLGLNDGKASESHISIAQNTSRIQNKIV